MKKILRVEVEEIPETTYTYSYSYVDNKGFKTTVENIASMEELEKDVKKKMRHLTSEDYKIVKKK